MLGEGGRRCQTNLACNMPTIALSAPSVPSADLWVTAAGMGIVGIGGRGGQRRECAPCRP